MVYMIFYFVIFICLIKPITPRPPKLLKDENKLTKRNVINIHGVYNSDLNTNNLIRSFTDYYLHYDHKKGNKCYKNDQQNLTLTMIGKMITMCPNQLYRPRIVTRSQISWKSTSSKSSTNKTSESTLPSNSPVKKKERIDPYLVFVIFLPDHPFSSELLKKVSSIAPMFPYIYFIFGNAHEFKDITTSYLISNFPKVLFFKNGIYVGDYDELKDELDFAIYLSKWTKALPVTYPNLINKSPELKSHIYLNTTMLPALHQYHTILDDIPFPTPNLEPFIANFQNYAYLDFLIYLLSSIYSIFRLTLIAIHFFNR